MTQHRTRSTLGTLGAEAVATALLMIGGLTAVILVVSPTGPLAGLDVAGWARRFVAGGLFGLSGTAASLSRWGRRSGAHLNPAVTLAFRVEGTISTALATGYVLAQTTGAIAGAAVVRLWGPWGRGVRWGATVPEVGLAAWQAAGLEALVTFALVALVLAMAARPTIRHLTPWVMGPLYAVLVAIEAPLTGTSSNPARSLGPAVVTWTWREGWVYWVGPAVGALVAVAVLHLVTRHRVGQARLVYDRLLVDAEHLAADLLADLRPHVSRHRTYGTVGSNLRNRR
ncbi:aquaporin [Isoptericola sp. b441]|uniref:Aquaporin n=1 Tax=Actinotalea lenta TaxID=3064654 RepID=A0ABT9D8R8_9CELL|nr:MULTISPECIES: aquaporin [unclassified Isoptericola]MDO8106851.1 aquaporin [Isoptericola sp. b441]MDO8121438.1 aquaporin [Isoptericola sp. b490]